MDLAQSILKELITLQNKNEELARIISKLEHESDVIIQQFEHKIEELQKSLKHEQNDKERAARRYEEEIRDLQGSKAALIHETADVRETFQAEISQLEKRISSLTGTMEVREKEFSSLSLEKERIIAVFTQDLKTLQTTFSSYENETEKIRNTLSSRVQALTDTLEKERKENSDIINRKDHELRHVQDSLLSATEELQEYEDREKVFREKSRRTIDNLHDLVQAERQVRNRELKERDDRITVLEDERNEAVQSVSALKEQIRIGKEHFDHEVSQINSIVSESRKENSLLKEKISDLNSQLEVQAREFEDELNKNLTLFLSEKESLETSLNNLDSRLKSALASHREEIQVKDTEFSALLQKVKESEAMHTEKLHEWEDLTRELSGKVSYLEAEKSELAEQVHDAVLNNSRLEILVKRNETSFGEERRALIEQIAQHQKNYSETEQIHLKEISAVREHLNELLIGRNRAVSEKQVIEEYYRGEVSRLHDEISDIHNGMKEREVSFIHDIAERDDRITALSINNESLRSELERIRSQLGKLQETIRAEKDESVHALYREITSLEGKLAGKNIEIMSLSDRLFRLDTENTRLLQALSERTTPSIPSEDTGTEIRSGSPALSVQDSDPRKREIAALVADLEDPSRAAGAAETLAAMGGEIVDHLIPLLHAGSIQRRVWIAVVLYELNDNRATLPLMKLLETPKVHFRELIWEAKKQLHSRIRTGNTAKYAEIRIGPDGFDSL